MNTSRLLAAMVLTLALAGCTSSMSAAPAQAAPPPGELEIIVRFIDRPDQACRLELRTPGEPRCDNAPHDSDLSCGWGGDTVLFSFVGQRSADTTAFTVSGDVSCDFDAEPPARKQRCTLGNPDAGFTVINWAVERPRQYPRRAGDVCKGDRFMIVRQR